jgi:hypothetical protein
VDLARAALISLTGQPRDNARAPLALAGKTLARRQLDFALAAGCESVIVLGDGGSAEAIALRHAAEAAGARFQAIRDSHGLLGAVRADDELLVLAPGLLPDAPSALKALGKGRAVLVLPAGPSVAAGFERIDLERAWAGAIVVGGAQVEQLSDLPADIEPASALVRIALQARVPERRLLGELLTDGSWSILDEGAGVAAVEQGWLNRHLPSVPPWAITKWLATYALRPLAGRLLAAPRSTEALMAGALAALVGSVLTAWYGLASIGFALVPLGAILAQAASSLASLQRAPFGSAKRTGGLAAVLPWLVDAAILACAVLAIEGTWLHRLFPPLVLLGTLHAVRRGDGPEWTALAADRALLAAALAIAAGFGFAEPAIMLASLGLVALNLAKSGASRG